MGFIELIIIGFVFGSLGAFAWSLVDMLKRQEWQWKAIGQDRTAWLLVLLFGGVLGAAAYLLAIRPKFARVEALGGATFAALPAAAPGWYPDPSGAPAMRWFDGYQWTPHQAPLPGTEGAVRSSDSNGTTAQPTPPTWPIR